MGAAVIPARRRLACGLAAAALAAGLLGAGARAAERTLAAPRLRISEVYGGGGNSGAPWRNDFVELFNAGGAAADGGGLSVQYASATGSSWQVTALAGSLAAGRDYLVRLASGGASGAELPTPDATGTINLSATAGKVALVRGTTPLSCATGCASLPQVLDFVGYGSTASSAEGSPAPGGSNTTSVQRRGGGCVDEGNNASDFLAASPTPQNSSVTGGPCSSPPQALDDAAEVRAGSSVTLDLVANDTDPDGDPLAVAGLGAAVLGSVRLEADGTVTYTAAPQAGGDDSFTYLVTDNRAGFAEGRVAIRVIPANHPPLAVDDRAVTDEDTAVEIDLLANDTDPDADPLTLAAVGAPQIGTAEPVGGGRIRYTPQPDAFGVDRFPYTVSDGRGGEATAWVEVVVRAVNDPPVARDDEASTPQYEAVTIEVLANDTDPDADPLHVAAVDPPSHGTVDLEPDGRLTYRPDPTFKGEDSFRYTVADGNGGLAAATVHVREVGCGEDGLDALAGSPAQGAVSGLVDRDLEPAAGGLDPEAARMLHRVDCDVVVGAEAAAGG